MGDGETPKSATTLLQLSGADLAELDTPEARREMERRAAKRAARRWTDQRDPDHRAPEADFETAAGELMVGGESREFPSPDDLCGPVLRAVKFLGGLASNREIDATVASEMGFSESDWDERYRGGRPRLTAKLRVARTQLRKAGLVASRGDGHWAITDLGEEIKSDAETRDKVQSLHSNPQPVADGGRTWVLATGPNGDLWPAFRDHEIAAVGWHEVGDLEQYTVRQGLTDAMIEADAGTPTSASMLWKFGPMGSMKPGDIIVARRGVRQVVGYGRVESDYRYDETLLPGKPHTRKVAWRALGADGLPTEWGLPQNTLVEYTNKVELKLLRRLIPEIDDLPDAPTTQTAPIKRVPSALPSYKIDDALTDLFLSRTQFEYMLKALRTRKNLILQGPPGTGKTFMARRLAWCLVGRQQKDALEMVQFHQSYAYEDFVQGYRPNEKGGFVLRSGVFLEFCEKAQKRSETPHVLVIDEINRGNLSRIFGELLMLIEADKRDEKYAVSMTYGEPGDRFHIPPNLHILGLMNTADRSLAVVDYALRRRFAFEELRPAFGGSDFKSFLVDKRGADSELAQAIDDRLQRLNDQIAEDSELGPGFCIGHSYFVPEEGEHTSRDWYENVVRTQIAPLLREYWFESDSRESAESAVEELLAH